MPTNKKKQKKIHANRLKRHLKQKIIEQPPFFFNSAIKEKTQTDCREKRNDHKQIEKVAQKVKKDIKDGHRER